MKRLTVLMTLLLLVSACGRSARYDDEIQSAYPTSSTANVQCTNKIAGQSFTCADGCNTCSCDSQGHLQSTLMACLP